MLDAADTSSYYADQLHLCIAVLLMTCQQPLFTLRHSLLLGLALLLRFGAPYFSK